MTELAVAETKNPYDNLGGLKVYLKKRKKCATKYINSALASGHWKI